MFFVFKKEWVVYYLILNIFQMKLIYIVALLAVVFCLSFKPEGFRLPGPLHQGQRVVTKPSDPQCCSKTNYMANNNTQCEYAHYQGVQFADPQYGCPVRHPKAYMGAIIGR